MKEIKRVNNMIIEDHKEVSLIMLLGNGTESYTDAFDYVISAKWLNDYEQDEGIDIILDYLYGNLSFEYLKHISRVTIIHTDDSIVKNITKATYVSDSLIVGSDMILGDLVVVPYTIIMEARS